MVHTTHFFFSHSLHPPMPPLQILCTGMREDTFPACKQLSCPPFVQMTLADAPHSPTQVCALLLFFCLFHNSSRLKNMTQTHEHMPPTWKQPARAPICADRAGIHSTLASIGTCPVFSFFLLPLLTLSSI